MAMDSSLEAVRELEQRITERLQELEQVDGPVQQARARAEELIQAGRTQAQRTADQLAGEIAERGRDRVHRLESDTQRRIDQLRASSQARRAADLALVRAAILPSKPGARGGR